MSDIRIVGLQRARIRTVLIDGEAVPTAIYKKPVASPVVVDSLGLQGDEHAEPKYHGGPQKAVYAYPAEHYDFWRRGRANAGVAAELAHGDVGENLTLTGLLESEVWIGDVLQFPDCSLRVTEPRIPCFKFNAAMGFNQAVKRMAQSGLCGFYLAVEVPGTLRVGDTATVVPGARELSIPARFQAIMFKS